VQLLWHPDNDIIIGAPNEDKQTLPKFYFYKPPETLESSTVNPFSMYNNILKIIIFFRGCHKIR
jgi:hypothetical protein